MENAPAKAAATSAAATGAAELVDTLIKLREAEKKGLPDASLNVDKLILDLKNILLEHHNYSQKLYSTLLKLTDIMDD